MIHDGFVLKCVPQFQQTQVDKLCERLENPNSSRPMDDEHMLLSDRDKVALCYVPKSGCTTLKALLLLTLGKNIT